MLGRSLPPAANFVIYASRRPGILVLVNDVDWELRCGWPQLSARIPESSALGNGMQDLSSWIRADRLAQIQGYRVSARTYVLQLSSRRIGIHLARLSGGLSGFGTEDSNQSSRCI